MSPTRASAIAAVTIALLALVRTGLAQSTTRAVPETPANDYSMGSAVLLSRTAHRDDRRTFFSFAGLRGSRDAGRRVGDVQFQGDSLTVRKHTGDRSTIVDLGSRAWHEVASLPGAGAADAHSVIATAGHVYLVHVDDTDADFWAPLRLDGIVPNDRCEVEWIRLNEAPRPPPPALLPVADRLAELLRAQDDNVDPAALLRTPVVVLQVRAGAGGGNPNRIDMLGRTTAYVRRVSPEPLSFDRPPHARDPSTAYFSGGRVPPGKCFVIQKVSFRGTAAGDSNGRGAFVPRAGRTEVANERDVPVVAGGKWEGRIEVRPGEEGSVYLEVANSSAGDVRIEGEIVDEPGQRKPDAGADRALLEQEPRVVLQVRAGAGGGNPNRIDMVGGKSTHLNRISDKPLTFDNPPDMRERSVGYYKGCRVPPGKCFVIKRITYSGTAKGDSNGHGSFVVRAGSTEVVNVRDEPVVPKTVWTGELPIRRGEESSVYLEVANSSSGDVLIEGEFIDDPQSGRATR